MGNLGMARRELEVASRRAPLARMRFLPRPKWLDRVPTRLLGQTDVPPDAWAALALMRPYPNPRPGKRSPARAITAGPALRAHTDGGDSDENTRPHRRRSRLAPGGCGSDRLLHRRRNPETDHREERHHLAQADHHAEQRASVAARREGQTEQARHRIAGRMLHAADSRDAR